MSREKGTGVVNSFYQSFNDIKLDELYILISPNIRFALNMHKANYGKENFIQYMNDSILYFDEKVSNIIIMANDDGKHISTKFTWHCPTTIDRS